MNNIRLSGYSIDIFFRAFVIRSIVLTMESPWPIIPPVPLKGGVRGGGNWLIVNSLGFICPREFFYYVLSCYRAYDGIPLAQSPSPIKRGQEL